MTKVSDFLAWLRAQQGAAYVWDAQGQEARADGALYLDGKRVSPSWEKWVDTRETNETNAKRAKAYIKKKLDSGDAGVSLFDCSGLLMRYLADIARLFPGDKTADGLYAACRTIERAALSPGSLVFRHNGKKAHHVGVYLGENMAVEAQGRDAGVVVRKLDASGANYWNRFGALPCFAPEAPSARAYFARCAGGSVNVRKSPGTEHGILCVTHKGDLLLAAPCTNPDWRAVALRCGEGLVTGYMYAQYIEGIEEGI